MSPSATNIVVALGREAAERAGEAPTIARRPTLTSGELLLRCAVHLSAEAHDIADHVAQTHPVPRVRAGAIAALAAVREGAGRPRCWSGGCGIAMRGSGRFARGGWQPDPPCRRATGRIDQPGCASSPTAERSRPRNTSCALRLPCVTSKTSRAIGMARS